MSTLNNIEKMIQMATIEHMYSLLQNMRTNVVYEKDQTTCNNSTFTATSEDLIQRLNTTCNNGFQQQSLLSELFTNKLDQVMTHIQMLSDKIDRLHAGTTLSPCTQTNKITNYFPKSEEPEPTGIKLTILEDETMDSDDEEDINPALITCSTIEFNSVPPSNNENMSQIELPVTDTSVNIELKIEEISKPVPEVVDEESSESEVATDDEEEEVVKEVEEEEEEEVVKEVEEEEEEEAVTEDLDEELSVGEELGEQEEEEEEQELFEIEIDDITYYATDEENGVLYAVEKNGDVGKKVGIIKDGEPIFKK
jgi:hypothetical protein